MRRTDEPRPASPAQGGRALPRILQVSLHEQLKLARFWLPLAIVGVVVLHQVTLLGIEDSRANFWANLLFYGLLGPTVTFVTLTWIASEVRQRERAQQELGKLYRELESSHRLLAAIQHVTEQFASAPDLEATLRAASQGICDVTGAFGAAIFLQAGGASVTEQRGMPEGLLAQATARDAALQRGEALLDQLEGESGWTLSVPLVWSGRLEGSVHAFYAAPPESEAREGFTIVAAEFSAAAEAARGRTRDLVTLLEVDRSIRAEGNLERLLAKLLTQMAARAEATMGGVYLADEAGVLRPVVAQGVPGEPDRQPVRLGEGLIGGVARARQARVAARLSAADKERSSGLLARAGSAVALPLVSSEGLLGVVVLAHEHSGHFNEAALPFLDLLAGQVGLALRNARAYLQSEELAIAEERARIAREIHDGVAQTLAFSALKLDLASRLLESDPSKAEAELRTTRQTLRETIKEVRRSIFALRPVDLERHGFVETIRRYCDDYGQQNALKVTLEVGELPKLSLQSEAVLFRIFQEAMNNAAKHAAASHVRVSLGSAGDQAFVRVEDDGRGFDPEVVGDRVTSAGGLGLKQMRERVVGRGGGFLVRSRPGQGTEVYASVPD